MQRQEYLREQQQQQSLSRGDPPVQSSASQVVFPHAPDVPQGIFHTKFLSLWEVEG